MANSIYWICLIVFGLGVFKKAHIAAKKKVMTDVFYRLDSRAFFGVHASYYFVACLVAVVAYLLSVFVLDITGAGDMWGIQTYLHGR